MLGNIGVMLHTGDMPIEEISRYAQAAEALGYEGFWITEESGKEGFIVLASVARDTQRIKLGTSILNFYSRTPTLLALGASTLYRISGGRFIHFGLGTGGIGFTERGHGVKIERPLARARETVEIVRGLLTSQRFSYEGQWFHVQDFRFREGPLDGRMFLYLSALNPKMVGLAARVADGLIANWFTEEAYEEYTEIVQQEAEAVGRNPDEVKLFSLTMMAGEDDASAEAMRRGLAFYFASPHYHHIADISGYGAQAKQVQAAWQSRDFAGASRLVTDAMVEKFAVMGSLAQRRKKLRWMMERNVYPIMYPIPRPEHTIEDHFLVIELAARYLGSEGMTVPTT
jgi:alkanesulfonate monooxygenase SsuD/methylene tetrahydromethanopterin reductase-like flavin-dependent oxidoreductase (luciferase family)